jgi:hypothetical protein
MNDQGPFELGFWPEVLDCSPLCQPLLGMAPPGAPGENRTGETPEKAFLTLHGI